MEIKSAQDRDNLEIVKNKKIIVETHNDYFNQCVLGQSQNTNQVVKNTEENIICEFNINRKSDNLIENKLVTTNNQNEKVENDNKSNNASENEVKYQKNIINCLDKICVAQYNINPIFHLDPLFFDILCINCYECVKYHEVDKHSEICIVHPDEGKYYF